MHTLFIKDDGGLWAMGANAAGQLGDGSLLNRTNPVFIAGDVVKASAGNGHSLFIKADGSLWGMGANANGQLGDGTTLDRRSPVMVASEVAGASARGGHSLFFKTNRSLWAMGQNHEGQLGDGTTTARTNPVQVASEVAAVAAGFNYSLFVKTDGTLWGMGRNGRGQLGDGSMVTRTNPVLIATGVKAVAAGSAHSLFLKNDGTLWGMGDNMLMQVGPGLSPFVTTPALVATNVADFGAGGLHTLILNRDGGLSARGEGTSGQLGLGGLPFFGSGQVAAGVTAVAAGGAHSLFLQPAGAPVVSVPPTSQSVPLGGNASFTVVASGADPLAYQWRKDGSLLAGATNTALVVANVTLADTGTYDVLVSNGSGATNSVPAQLIVLAAPEITVPPQSVTATVGTDVSFSVTATGTAPLAYQWRRNGTNLAAAAGATLSLTNAQGGAAGTYSVVIANSVGSVTSAPVALTLTGPPSFSVQPPASLTVAAGSPLSFGATVGGGTPPFSYQWFKDGQPISGATGSNLSSSAAATNLTGVYALVVANATGSVTSAPVMVSVLLPVTITAWPPPQTVATGAPVTFSVQTTGDPPLTFLWRKDGVFLSAVTGPTLFLPGTQTGDSGGYTVQVTNPVSSRLSPVIPLSVLIPPVITAPPTNQTVPQTVTASLRVVATGSEPLGFQWFKDGIPLTGATATNLTITNTQPAHAGSYTVMVSSLVGSVTSAPAILTVGPPPVPPRVVRQPADVLVDPGTPFLVTLEVEGDGPFEFVWGKFMPFITPSIDGTGTNYDFGTNASGYFQRTTAPQLGFTVTAPWFGPGYYDVTVIGPGGAARSRAFRVSGRYPLTIHLMTSSKVVPRGTYLDMEISATGTFPLRYQWRKDGTNVSTVVTYLSPSQFAIPSFQPEHAGTYEVVISDLLGTITSRPIVLGITPTPGLHGEIVPAFSPPVLDDPGIHALAVQPDGRILIGGSFAPTNASGAFTVPPRLARLLPNGSLDASFSTGSGPDAAIRALALEPDGGAWLGGDFTKVHGTDRQRLARVLADGTLAPGFAPSADATVRVLLRQPDGKLLVAGDFSAVNGSLCPHLARLNPDGSFDALFQPQAGPNAAVRAVALLPDGKLMLGGEFTQVNGVVRGRIARLNADGTLDPGFNSTVGANGSVLAINPMPDGSCYAIGDFTLYDGVDCGQLLHLRPDGTADPASPRIVGRAGKLTALAVQADAKILLGGTFSEIEIGTGASLSLFRSYGLLRLLADGSPDLSFDVGQRELTGAHVDGLRLLASGDVLVQGFNTFMGYARPGLALLRGGLTVAAAPTIQLQPMAGTFPAGGTHTLSVFASGSQPLYYYWRKDGIDLPGQPSLTASLAIAASRTANGTYSVLASNYAGIALSTNALLRFATPMVLSPPVFPFPGVVSLSFRDQFDVPLNDVDVPRFEIWTTTNLLGSNWFKLASPFTISNGVMHLLDGNGAGQQRFYRVQER